jgi:hypothetical protein
LFGCHIFPIDYSKVSSIKKCSQYLKGFLCAILFVKFVKGLLKKRTTARCFAFYVKAQCTAMEREKALNGNLNALNVAQRSKERFLKLKNTVALFAKPLEKLKETREKFLQTKVSRMKLTNQRIGNKCH